MKRRVGHHEEGHRHGQLATDCDRRGVTAGLGRRRRLRQPVDLGSGVGEDLERQVVLAVRAAVQAGGLHSLEQRVDFGVGRHRPLRLG